MTNNQAAGYLTKIIKAVGVLNPKDTMSNYDFQMTVVEMKKSILKTPELLKCLKVWSDYWIDPESSDKAYTKPYEH